MRKAVTSLSELFVLSHRGQNSAPRNIPSHHQRSHFAEHQCSLGWMLPYSPELAVEAVRLTEEGHTQLSEANYCLVEHSAGKQWACLVNNLF